MTHSEAPVQAPEMPTAITQAESLSAKPKSGGFNYARSMLALGFLYVGFAAAFFFFHEEVLSLLNLLPSIFRFAEPIASTPERFWPTLGAAGALTFALLSFTAWRSPASAGYAVVHCLSKAVASGAFFYLFFKDRPYFAYFAGGTVDGLLALFVFWKALFARGGVS